VHGVPRHHTVPPAGFEPATHGLGRLATSPTVAVASNFRHVVSCLGLVGIAGQLWSIPQTIPHASDRWRAISLAAVVGHLSAWPRRRTRFGLPWLKDCEGLGPELMPLYNPILYASGAAALGALLVENRTA
jgi:hypothetical protein